MSDSTYVHDLATVLTYHQLPNLKTVLQGIPVILCSQKATLTFGYPNVFSKVDDRTKFEEILLRRSQKWDGRINEPKDNPKCIRLMAVTRVEA